MLVTAETDLKGWTQDAVQYINWLLLLVVARYGKRAIIKNAVPDQQFKYAPRLGSKYVRVIAFNSQKLIYALSVTFAAG